MTAATDLPHPPPLLDLLARGPLALFLDFDGTLVDIAPTPDAIAVPPRLGELLAELSDRLGKRLALVSGRAINNLEQHCGPLRVTCAGSHGAELRAADGSPLGAAALPLPAAAIADVARFAADHGVSFEAKAHGAALHSRADPEREEACALFMDELALQHGLMVKRGKRVAELVRPGCRQGPRGACDDGRDPICGCSPGVRR